MEITDIVLLEKTGGKSGEYRRDTGARGTGKKLAGKSRVAKSMGRGR
jgi:hypothetical protein